MAVSRTPSKFAKTVQECERNNKERASSQSSVSGKDERRTISEKPTQLAQPNQYNGPALPRDVKTNVVTDATTRAAADSTKKTYSSNPTYSKGNTVTDEDLEKLSEALYIKETNNANQYITVNLQKRTTSSNLMDQAPQPLLTISSEALQIPTVQRVLSIFDNYQLDTHTNEYINPTQRQEESFLLDTFLSTNVMSTAMRFLADKGFIRRDYYEYKDALRRLWFNLFSRGQGKIGSTGFEHVFMAETKRIDSDTQVLGLHNWIYFNAEEIKQHTNYLGYIKKTDLGNKGSIIKMHVKFNNHDKPVTTIFVGTSPELEMSLYTVCFYARPDGNCPLSLGGTKFNIITHKFRYRGKDLIGTAYPEI
ncbi:poly(U)-specific endoribonuclease homolog [Nylanderia fulva]|uniref:poly(U)-specific endoribonuclease homolog n=1 Tax=Nylanderia fulva TaxID=613905 RepID=UPI0010FB207C|nr:poly(U)-specific endoribonuclease homolog [Nylanderia fulva]